MLKNKIWLGIILSIVLLIFSVDGFTAYYKYTQESGTNFYVGTADKSDALEDTNEMRQIIDDLGALLVHDKRNDLYPKDETTGGTIQIPEAGLKFSNAPANNDVAAYIAGEMTWQTKAELGLDLSLYYLKTAIDSQGEMETIWGVTLATDSELSTGLGLRYLKTEIDTLGEVETIYSKDITDSTELASALTAYYLKTAIDTIGEVEAIWVKNITDSIELASALTDYYLKTAIDSQGEMETIWGVSLANDSELHTQNTDTDLDTTFEATFVKKVDTVNVLSDITSSGANIEDAVTKKHSQNTDTDLDATFEATFVKKVDTVNVLSDITSSGANIEDAVTKKHTSGSETLAGDVSGTVGANTVNKIKGHTVDETAIANDKILVYKTTGDKFVYETQSGGVDTSGTPEANDIARFTDADTIEGINYTELKTALALSSDDLSDVASIAMLDESETVTGVYTFTNFMKLEKFHDSPGSYPFFTFDRKRDGDPTYDVSSGDTVGGFVWDAYHTGFYSTAARIRVIVDGDAGDEDMPGRLEFLTTADGDSDSTLRMAIDSAGNIKMGDGSWTNYVNVSAGGAMTAEGTASIKATDLVFTNALASDHTYSGEVDSQPVGESVVFGDLLYFNWTDKEWKKTDADAAATVPGLRIALETKTDGQTCLMLVKGYIKDVSAFEFAGSMVYTSVTPGAMSSTVPTEIGDQIQRVGVAKSADILFFDPSIDVGEI